MKIGELARLTGVSPRLLRYYEEQGLLMPRRVGTHRSYADDAPEVVGHIRAFLGAGLPTRVIREVLPCVEGPGPALHGCVARTLEEQLRGLDDRIAGLQDSRSALAGLLEAGPLRTGSRASAA
ncbi:MerR family transcriptional regulator [Streptomyces qinzhouensis]|uniref:MerR family transcriptional regulator n=1 Tax=Streptomyces qinzhouensis TaxID=2599401 RepID=A0A5B8JI70_9ACTN|nr:MerR family transcriptional regulator [Streptomyces qinzhouensis]QDY77213.1 MerR family transcriptional regulator [Streptomyces qinzhouensis]